MIDLAALTIGDVGREVTFTYHHGEKEYGHLSSWNERYVFVRFRGPNGAACNPEMCEFSL
jgi:hypothetical protein